MDIVHFDDEDGLKEWIDVIIKIQEILEKIKDTEINYQNVAIDGHESGETTYQIFLNNDLRIVFDYYSDNEHALKVYHNDNRLYVSRNLTIEEALFQIKNAKQIIKDKIDDMFP